MASDRYVESLPTILDWIQRTFESYANEKRSVPSFSFSRLPHYFSAGLFSSVSAVITDRLPVPPLSSSGLSEFARFERQPSTAITYLDTYFVEPRAAADESVHFHKLVHVNPMANAWAERLPVAVRRWIGRARLPGLSTGKDGLRPPAAI
jgi:hypothetical protein